MGWRKGITGQLGSVVAIILAILMCRAFGEAVTAHFLPEEPSVADTFKYTVLCYLLVAVGTYVAVRIAAGALRSLLRSIKLGLADRSAGAVFCAFEWLIGISLLLNLWLCIFRSSDIRETSNSFTTAVIDLAPALMSSEWLHNLNIMTNDNVSVA